MGKKVIRVHLSPEGIDKAIKEIEQFKREFLQKVDIYRRKIAEEIANSASLNFGSAWMEDVIKGRPRKPEVTVDVSEQGKISVVVANGEDAVWCEFGAGVYHNGSAGSSPNPWGNDLGFTIGSYGKGFGRFKAWGYYEGGRLIVTRGTPASMPMYNAAQEVAKRAIEIAREVWK